MEISMLNSVLLVILLIAIVLFLFATLRGGKMLGGFMDRRREGSAQDDRER